MKYLLLTSILIFLLASYASGGNETAVSGTESLPSWITSKTIPYDAIGKPDPFVSFVQIREYETMQAAKKSKVEKKVLTPLENVDVHELKLVGIVYNETGKSRAMVELPDGKGFMIHIGTPIGLYDGKVKTIEDGMLTVEEDVVDVFEETKKRIVNLRLRQEKE